MRRADIARWSTVSSGADYIFTLPDQRARGRRLVASIDLLHYEAADRHLGLEGLSRYGVTCGSLYLNSGRRWGPISRARRAVPSTEILMR